MRQASWKIAGPFVALLIARAGFAQAGSDTAPPPPPIEESEAEAPPPPDAQPPAQALDARTAEQRLSPYGRWVDTPEYGRVWIPNGVPPDWQPYTDGRWVYTGMGWSFAADVPWGGIVFHYGRWGWSSSLGWYWVPGYVWAPAWVSWRYSGGHVCWSPFGPAGYVYPRNWPGWAVVPVAHFTHPLRHEILPRAHGHQIVRAARAIRSIEGAPRPGVAYGPPRARPAPHGAARGHEH
jgi:hypothetical protein